MSGRFTYQTSWGANVPASSNGSGVPLLVANLFKFSIDGWIVGLRYYRISSDNGEHIGAVMGESDNVCLNALHFKYRASGGSAGWEHAYFGRRVPVAANTLYYIIVSYGSRFHSHTTGALTGSTITNGDVIVPADTSSFWNGISGAGFDPDGWAHQAGTRYGVDCLFLKEGALN